MIEYYVNKNYEININYIGCFFLAIISSLFAWPELPVFFLFLAYYYSFQIIAQTTSSSLKEPEVAGDSERLSSNDVEWHSSALNLYIRVLCWTVIIFAIIYWRYNLISNGIVHDTSFLESIYFSITTWTTLGYGDFAPTPRIRHITSIEAILGYIGLGLLVTLISNYINSIYEKRKEDREYLARALKDKSLDPEYPTTEFKDKEEV